MTFPQALIESVEAAPDRIQFVTASGTEVTLADFYKLSRSVAKGCMHLGLEPFEGVGILGFNCVEWFSVDIGVTLACGVPAGIYTTNLPDIVAYILNHSNSNIIFVDTEDQLKKVLSVADKCEKLKAVIVWGELDLCNYAEHGDLVRTWDQFIKLADNVSDNDLDARIAIPTPENVCKLIYTSGTTGPPKAVMISHDNVVFTSKMMRILADITPDDRLVSYLPCSHIAANTNDIAGSLINGFRITFADRDALKGSLVKTLKEVRPTILLAVPRVYEKIREKLLEIGATSGPIKRAISTWAKGVGRMASEARDIDDDLMPWGYRLADMLVFQNVKKALGLDRCRFIVNTAAPMQRVTDDYFRSLDFRILDLYGMSEATGPVCANFPHYRRGTSGKVIDGIEAKLHGTDETGEGELCFRGRNMFAGYMENPKESCEVMDEEGFVHSGDLARIDADGFITITGRAKELIVTAGGENVAPAMVESTLISSLPAVSRAFAVGDQKKFISCLLVPYMAEDGTLVGPATQVSSAETASEASEDAAWQRYIEEGIGKANEKAISNAARVRKFTILRQDFSVDGGELTPTLKVKRSVVVKKLEKIIDGMYDA